MKLKKLLLISTTAFSTLLSNAQITRQWVATYNGSGDFNDRYTCVTTDQAGNIYVGGSTTNNGADRDYLILKLNSSGSVVWSQQYSGDGLSTDEVTAIAADASGNVYVTGFSKGLNTSVDYLTIKLNSAGDTIWTRRYDYVGEYDQANSIFVDGSGNIYVTGQSDSDISSFINDDYLTIKYASNGVQLWQKRFDGFGGALDRAVKVLADASGNVYITGRSDNGTNDDYVTIKYNGSGTQQWIKYDDRGDIDRPSSMAIDINGNLYITGRSNNGTNDDYWTLKYNSAGTLLWQQVFDFVEDDQANAIAVDATGNCYITGQSDGDATAVLNFDYQTIAYNSAGTQLWQKRFDGTVLNDDKAVDISFSGNKVYVTGISDIDGTAGISNDIVTKAYDASTGTENWTASFAGNPNNNDESYAVRGNSNGCVVVGFSEDASTQRNAIAIQYNIAGAQSWSQVTNGYGDNNENVRAIAVDVSSNVYAAGYSVEKGVNRDFALVKFNSNGSFICKKTIDGTSTGSVDDAQSIALDNNGNAVLAGYTKNKSTSNDIQLASFNTNCDTAWTKIINGPGNGSDKAYDMVRDNSGNFYFTGRVSPVVNTTNDNCYTAKFDASGNLLWAQTFNIASNEDRGVVIRVSQTGNVYVAGRTFNGTDYDLFLLKYDNAGNQQWVQNYSGGIGDDEPNDMVLDAAENIFISGNTEETTDLVFDYLTLKYKSDGTQDWIRKYNGTGAGDDESVSIAVDLNGNVFVIGKSDVDASINQNFDIVTIKYDVFGNQIWATNYNGTQNLDDSGDDIAVDNFNQIYITGHTNKGSLSSPNYDAITSILDPSGNVIWSDLYNGPSDSSDVPNLIQIIGNDFYVAGSTVEGNQMRNMMIIKYSGAVGIENTDISNGLLIYPNPFYNEIKLDILNSGVSTFIVSNSIGQKIFETTVHEGSNTIDMPVLTDGFYFYQILNQGIPVSGGKLVHQTN